MTMGIVSVASLAARVADGPPVTITSTFRRTSSVRRNGRGGAVAGGGDRLARRVLADIADGVEAGARRLHPVVRWHMAAVRQFYDITQERRVGLQTDVNEKTGKLDLHSLARLAGAHAGDDFVADDFLDDCLITRRDLRVVQYPSQIGLLRCKRIAVMEQ